jgi:hypothetical protein
VVKSDVEVDGRRSSKRDVPSLPQDPKAELGHATSDGERYPVSIVKVCVENGNEGAEDEGRLLLRVSEAVEGGKRVSTGLFYSGFSLSHARRAKFPQLREQGRRILG